MQLQGTHQFKAPLPVVWQALLDPTVLAKALPGGDQLERVGENDYKAAMNVRVGPVQGRFEGKVTLLDIVEHQSYRMVVSGTGGPGFLNGEGVLTLATNAEGTLLTYTGEVQVGGRIAALGQRLIESTAKSIIRQGLKTLDDQLLQGTLQSTSQPTPQPAIITINEQISASAPLPSATTQTSEAAPKLATQDVSQATAQATRMAVDIAKEITQEIAADYIPRAKQPQAFAFFLGALSMLLFVILVRLVQRN